MLCLFYCLSLSSPYLSIFDGNLYGYSEKITKNQELYFELLFYLSDSNRQILKPIDLLAKDIINKNINDTLFVLGKINIKQLISINNKNVSSEKYLPIAGIYKEKTQQFYLFHSLQHILTNESLSVLNYQENQFITDIKLISFLNTTKKIFENFNFNKSNMTENIYDLQSYAKANFPYSIEKNETLPLIYLESFHKNINTTNKQHYNYYINGYYMENNLSIKHGKIINYYDFLEIKAFQIDMTTFMDKFKTVNFIAILFLLFRFLLMRLYHINRIYINDYFNHEFNFINNYLFLILFLVLNQYENYNGINVHLYQYIIYISIIIELVFYNVYEKCFKFINILDLILMTFIFHKCNLLVFSNLYLFCIKIDLAPNFENKFSFKVKAAIFVTISTLFRFCEFCFIRLYYSNILNLNKEKSSIFIIITFILILIQIAHAFRCVLGIKFTLKNLKSLFNTTIDMFDSKKTHWFELAEKCEKNKNYDEAFKLYKKAAKFENDLAYRKLGSYYEDGRVVQKNIEISRNYYQKAKILSEKRSFDLVFIRNEERLLQEMVKLAIFNHLMVS